MQLLLKRLTVTRSLTRSVTQSLPLARSLTLSRTQPQPLTLTLTLTLPNHNKRQPPNLHLQNSHLVTFNRNWTLNHATKPHKPTHGLIPTPTLALTRYLHAKSRTTTHGIVTAIKDWLIYLQIWCLFICRVCRNYCQVI